jgi:hypothetical protein
MHFDRSRPIHVHRAWASAEPYGLEGQRRSCLYSSTGLRNCNPHLLSLLPETPFESMAPIHAPSAEAAAVRIPPQH